MLPDRVSNPGPLTYESGALPIALRGPAQTKPRVTMTKYGRLTAASASADFLLFSASSSLAWASANWACRSNTFFSAFLASRSRLWNLKIYQPQVYNWLLLPATKNGWRDDTGLTVLQQYFSQIKPEEEWVRYDNAACIKPTQTFEIRATIPQPICIINSQLQGMRKDFGVLSTCFASNTWE